MSLEELFIGFKPYFQNQFKKIEHKKKEDETRFDRDLTTWRRDGGQKPNRSYWLGCHLADPSTLTRGNSQVTDCFGTVYDTSLFLDYSDLRDRLQFVGKWLVYELLRQTAQRLGFETLEQNYKDDLPEVLIVDPAYHKYQVGNTDFTLDEPPFRHISPTFFAPRGMGKPLSFGHSSGPIIQIHLDMFDIRTAREEVIHYLQWFYAADPLLRAIRTERIQHNMEDEDKENAGRLILSHDEPSGIQIARIIPFDETHTLYLHMLYEATAAAYQVYFGDCDCKPWYLETEDLNTQHEKDKILGIPPDRRPSELAEILRSQDTRAFLETLFEWNEVGSVTALSTKYHFSSLFRGEGVYQSLAHTIGELIGRNVGTQLREKASVKVFTSRMFSRRDPESLFGLLCSYVN